MRAPTLAPTRATDQHRSLGVLSNGVLTYACALYLDKCIVLDTHIERLFSATLMGLTQTH